MTVVERLEPPREDGPQLISTDIVEDNVSSCTVFPLLSSLIANGKTAVVVIERRGDVEVRSLIADGVLIVGDFRHLAYYKEALQAGRLRKDFEDGYVIATRYDPAIPLVVVGSGLISRKIVETAQASGFAVVYVTDSPLPPKDVLTAKLEELGNVVNERTAVVIANEGGREYDVDAVDTALRKGAWYVALMASRRRAQDSIRELLRRGHNLDDLRKRLRSPAGLDIGTASPGEIAVSILAEIIGLKNGASFRPMVEVKSPFEGL
jgi:xanthine dehydrogenase accessory factor